MSQSPDKMHGRCLCGGVCFTLTAPFRSILVCHCRQCARWTGHAVYATAVAPERLRFDSSEDHIGWYRASEHAARGFCKTCGSSLFWKPDHGRHISVLAGSLDPPTGLPTSGHWHVADKSDYYQLLDGLPQHTET